MFTDEELADLTSLKELLSGRSYFTFMDLQNATSTSRYKHEQAFKAQCNASAKMNKSRLAEVQKRHDEEIKKVLLFISVIKSN